MLALRTINGASARENCKSLVFGDRSTTKTYLLLEKMSFHFRNQYGLPLLENKHRRGPVKVKLTPIVEDYFQITGPETSGCNVIVDDTNLPGTSLIYACEHADDTYIRHLRLSSGRLADSCIIFSWMADCRRPYMKTSEIRVHELHFLNQTSSQVFKALEPSDNMTVPLRDGMFLWVKTKVENTAMYSSWVLILDITTIDRSRALSIGDRESMKRIEGDAHEGLHDELAGRSVKFSPAHRNNPYR